MLDTLPIVFVLAGLVFYVVLGGADFGAGLWQLLAGRGHGSRVDPGEVVQAGEELARGQLRQDGRGRHPGSVREPAGGAPAPAAPAAAFCQYPPIGSNSVTEQGGQLAELMFE